MVTLTLAFYGLDTLSLVFWIDIITINAKLVRNADILGPTETSGIRIRAVTRPLEGSCAPLVSRSSVLRYF